MDGIYPWAELTYGLPAPLIVNVNFMVVALCGLLQKGKRGERQRKISTDNDIGYQDGSEGGQIDSGEQRARRRKNTSGSKTDEEKRETCFGGG